MAEAVTSAQQATLNAEGLSRLTSRIEAARLLLATRELGAGVDVNPQTKVRYSAVEQQRARDVARAAAREAQRKRDREEAAARRVAALSAPPEVPEAPTGGSSGGASAAPQSPAAPAAASSSLSSSAAAQAQAATSPAASPAQADEAAPGAVSGRPISSGGAPGVHGRAGKAWGEGTGRERGGRRSIKISAAEGGARGVLAARALTESESLFHANVAAADPTAVLRGGQDRRHQR